MLRSVPELKVPRERSPFDDPPPVEDVRDDTATLATELERLKVFMDANPGLGVVDPDVIGDPNGALTLMSAARAAHERATEALADGDTERAVRMLAIASDRIQNVKSLLAAGGQEADEDEADAG